jgi:hypothetical protein
MESYAGDPAQPNGPEQGKAAMMTDDANDTKREWPAMREVSG